MTGAADPPLTVLYLGTPFNPSAIGFLRDALPDGVQILGEANTLQDLADMVSDDDLKGVVVLVHRNFSTSALQMIWPKMPNLRWIHSLPDGLNNLLIPEVVTSSVLVTNGRGVFDHTLAEWALFACLWFAKNAAQLRAQQQARSFTHVPIQDLSGSTLGIIGYGGIGRATAVLAAAYRMRVVALRRRPELALHDQQEGLLDAVYGPGEISSLMACSDYVVVATPGTAETQHLVDADAIAAMKPTAVLINVGRGSCVDEMALTKALLAGKIRGAALDVFEHEPLPPDNPLWKMDNVLISPHSAWAAPGVREKTLGVFVENMRRWLDGRELLNVCDKQQGY